MVAPQALWSAAACCRFVLASLLRRNPLPLTANSAASKLACIESGKLPHSKALRARSLRLIRWPGSVAECAKS